MNFQADAYIDAIEAEYLLAGNGSTPLPTNSPRKAEMLAVEVAVLHMGKQSAVGGAGGGLAQLGKH
jgi:hypothetical protein